MHNIITCGMQFGDEGKGTFIDYLTFKHKANWIVRYNGGSQASHTVETPNGTIHKYSQLASGFFNNSVKEAISSNMVINLDNLFTEMSVLAEKTHSTVSEIFNRLYINEMCLVVTPYHKLLNKLRELALGEKRRGSVGTGVSEVRYLYYISQPNYNGGAIFRKYGRLYLCLNDFLNCMDNKARDRFTDTFLFLRRYVRDFYLEHKSTIEQNMPDELRESIEKEIDYLITNPRTYRTIAINYIKKCEELLSLYPDILGKSVSPTPWIEELKEMSAFADFEEQLKKFTVIFEGSQGLLIDGKYGLRPNTTYLDTTNHHAEYLAKSILSVTGSENVDCRKIGIAKAFYSRHGIGVFPTESLTLEKYIRDKNQEETYWNGRIRFGWFDAVLFRYAQKINRVNEVFLSSLDKLNGLPRLKVCNSYRYIGEIDDLFKKVFSYYVDEHGNVIIVDILRSCKNISKYLAKCKPIYITVNGWKEVMVGKSFGYSGKLSIECEEYIRLISVLTKTNITCISYGPTRNEKLQIGGKYANVHSYN